MAELFASYEVEVARLTACNAALHRECGELMAAAAERDLEGVGVKGPGGAALLRRMLATRVSLDRMV